MVRPIAASQLREFTFIKDLSLFRMVLLINTDTVRIRGVAGPYSFSREGFVFIGDGRSCERHISLCFDVSSLVSDVFGFGNSHVATGIEQRRGTIQQGVPCNDHAIPCSDSGRLHLCHIC